MEKARLVDAVAKRVELLDFKEIRNKWNSNILKNLSHDKNCAELKKKKKEKKNRAAHKLGFLF